MTGSPADEDPGWPRGPRLLLFIVPGYLLMFARRAGVQDSLVLLRGIWLSLSSAIVLFGVVAILVVPGGKTSPALPWAVGISIVGLLSLIVVRSLGLRLLDCADETRLAGTYRTRFFLRMAISNAVAFMGFVAAFSAGHWWLYPLGAAFGLAGFASTAPTRGRLAADQQSLSAQGCAHDLVQALRRPMSPS